MEVPFKLQAIRSLSSYANVQTQDVIRILETVRDCYLDSSMVFDNQLSSDSQLEITLKRIISDEITSFISGIRKLQKNV